MTVMLDCAVASVGAERLLDFLVPGSDVIVPILVGEPESLIDASGAVGERTAGFLWEVS